MVSDLSRRLADFSTLVYGAAFVFWLLAVVVLSLFFSVTLNERKRELSLLRLLGASRAWLARLLLQEALLISLGGALAGLVLAALVIFPFGTLIFQNLGLPRLQVSGAGIVGYLLLTLVIAGATGPVASIYSALSITRYDTYDTLREGE
jgi:putative ABC transport system permease protein